MKVDKKTGVFYTIVIDQDEARMLYGILDSIVWDKSGAVGDFAENLAEGLELPYDEHVSKFREIVVNNCEYPSDELVPW
jgi:hypothetical protein